MSICLYIYPRMLFEGIEKTFIKISNGFIFSLLPRLEYCLLFFSFNWGKIYLQGNAQITKYFMSFNKCIHSCNQQPNLNIKYFQNHRNCPYTSFQSIFIPHCSDFYGQILVLPLQIKINEITQSTSFCVWLLLRIMFLRFIHFVAWLINLSLFIPEKYSIVWIYHNLFIHSSVDEHLDCLHFWVTMNTAVLNILI